MEAVHKPDSRPWILAGKVIIRDLLLMWSQNCVQNELNLNEHNISDYVKSELQIDQQMVELLEKDTNPKNMHCIGDDEELYVAYEKSFDIPIDCHLETLRLQREHVHKYATDRCYRTASLQSLRYRNRLIKVEKQLHVNGMYGMYVCHHMFDNHFNRFTADSLPNIERPEAILTVQFYRPVRFSTHFGNTHRYSFICDQELAVLSSQSLTQLRDAFTCVTDISTPGDCSQNPRDSLNTTAADVYKSGFFFINNTFYNDMRHAFNRDYSK